MTHKPIEEAVSIKSLQARIKLAEPLVDANVDAALHATMQRVAADRGVLGWLRALPMGWRLTASVAMFAVALMWKLATYKSAAAPALQALAMHGLVFTAATCLLFWPLSRPVPSVARALSIVTAFALPAAFGLWVHQSADALKIGTTGNSAWACLLYGSVLALPFAGLLKAFDRREALGTPRVLLLGATAGVAANALLHLHCADTGLTHLLLGHATIGMVIALGAARAGRARAV